MCYSNKKQESETEWELAERKQARCIYLTGRKGVTEYEAAVAIIDEAKGIIQEELGGLGIQWKSANSSPSPHKLKSPVLLSPLASKYIVHECVHLLSNSFCVFSHKISQRLVGTTFFSLLLNVLQNFSLVEDAFEKKRLRLVKHTCVYMHLCV